MKAYDALIEAMITTRMLKTPAIINAFRTIDRKHFVPQEHTYLAYGDVPLPIGYGATISQPSTVAFMLEHLDVQPGMHVLDIGTGSGWTAALLAHLVGPTGSVTGVELVPELVQLTQHNLNQYQFTQVHIHLAQENIGVPYHTFDRILVSAAATDIPPQLVEQLAPSGKMVIPVKTAITVVSKSDTDVNQWDYPGYVFVPLRMHGNSLEA